MIQNCTLGPGQHCKEGNSIFVILGIQYDHLARKHKRITQSIIKISRAQQGRININLEKSIYYLKHLNLGF